MTEKAKRPARESQSGTRSDEIAEQLVVEITSGTLAPGERLDEQLLSRRFTISRTPIRDALRQLEATGLVERQPYKGVMVTAPNAARVAEMFLAAGEIEATCARLCALSVNASERNAIRRGHEDMLAFVKASDSAKYRDANVTFHEKIYVGTHNAILGEIARDMRRRLMPYRRAQFTTRDRLAASFAEHEEIVRAIERGLGDEAAAHMRHHMRFVEAAVDRLASR